MAPPKCFFKRPEEFYLVDAPPKLECYSGSNSPVNHYGYHGETSPPNITKTESNLHHDFFRHETLPMDSLETPLDLSCKFVDGNNNELLQKIGSFLLQNPQSFLPNHYANLERLFMQLPQKMSPSYPKVYVTSPSKSEESLDELPKPVQEVCGSRRVSVDSQFYLSPQSVPESVRDNSSSETSSQYTSSQQKIRLQKRKTDGKVFRPFKLYKNNDSRGLMEALGINEEDEEWLKGIVEYKSVDDVFLFLTNCMSESSRPLDLTDEVIDKIQAKFGHIFQSCNKSISNPRMVRHPDMTPKELKTDEYWDKRRKNNEAAKRSREARRHKEDNLNQHCEKLQSENDSLRKEIERVKIRIEEVKRTIS